MAKQIATEATPAPEGKIMLAKGKRLGPEIKAQILASLIAAQKAKKTLEEFALDTFGLEIKSKSDPRAALVNSAIKAAWSKLVQDVAAIDPEEADSLGNPPVLQSKFGASGGGSRAPMAESTVKQLVAAIKGARS